MTWRDSAACLDEDPEVSFPTGSVGPALVQIEEARAICRGCEVVERCRTWTIEFGQDAGVWGGLSGGTTRPQTARRRRPPDRLSRARH